MRMFLTIPEVIINPPEFKNRHWTASRWLVEAQRVAVMVSQDDRLIKFGGMLGEGSHFNGARAMSSSAVRVWSSGTSFFGAELPRTIARAIILLWKEHGPRVTAESVLCWYGDSEMSHGDTKLYIALMNAIEVLAELSPEVLQVSDEVWKAWTMTIVGHFCRAWENEGHNKI